MMNSSCSSSAQPTSANDKQLAWDGKKTAFDEKIGEFLAII
jgi:hypothetical protein